MYSYVKKCNTVRHSRTLQRSTTKVLIHFVELCPYSEGAWDCFSEPVRVADHAQFLAAIVSSSAASYLLVSESRLAVLDGCVRGRGCVGNVFPGDEQESVSE